MKDCSIVVNVPGVSIVSRYERNCIALTGVSKDFDGGSALIERWKKVAVLFLGKWEQHNNPVCGHFSAMGNS